MPGPASHTPPPPPQVPDVDRVTVPAVEQDLRLDDLDELRRAGIVRSALDAHGACDGSAALAMTAAEPEPPLF